MQLRQKVTIDEHFLHAGPAFEEVYGEYDGVRHVFER